MIRFLQFLAKGLRQFRRDTAGNGTIEFVLVLPGFFVLFTSAYESGMLSTRQVMLEHALDVTVREVRIGQLTAPNATELHKLLVQSICDNSKVIDNCLNEVKLEMLTLDPRNWQAPSRKVDCIDREAEGEPSLTLNTGGNNQVMLLRVCAQFDPLVPTSGIGKGLVDKHNQPYYGLYAVSSFVMEPFQ